MSQVKHRRVWVEGGELTEGRWEIRKVVQGGKRDWHEELYRDRTRHGEMLHPDPEPDDADRNL